MGDDALSQLSLRGRVATDPLSSAQTLYWYTLTCCSCICSYTARLHLPSHVDHSRVTSTSVHRGDPPLCAEPSHSTALHQPHPHSPSASMSTTSLPPTTAPPSTATPSTSTTTSSPAAPAFAPTNPTVPLSSNGFPPPHPATTSPAPSPTLLPIPPPSRRPPLHSSDLSPAFTTLLNSVLHHLQSPSYPLPLDPASLVHLTVLRHLPLFHSLPAHLLLPTLTHLLSSSLPPHLLHPLSSHLHHHVDQLLSSVLSSHAFPALPSIPHIVDDDDDLAGGAHSIHGISGGTLRLYSDAHTARAAALRSALQRGGGVRGAVLVLPSIPNGFPYLDRLLAEVGMAEEQVRWVGLVPWLEVKGVEGAKGGESGGRGVNKEAAENGEHVNPLLTHRTDLADLQSTLTSLSSTSPPPSSIVFLTQLGSEWCGQDVVYFSDELAAVKRVCDPHSVWLHVEGDLLWKDDDLQRRLLEKDKSDRRTSKADKRGVGSKEGRDEKEVVAAKPAGHSQRGSRSNLTSTLYNSADSVVFSTSAFTSGSIAVCALKAREKAATTPRGSVVQAASHVPHTYPVEVADFAQLFRVWYDLSTAPSLSTVLSSATSSLVTQLTSFRHALLTQPFRIYLVAPVMEPDSTPHDISSSPPSSSSITHSHLFFQLTVSPPLTPSFFNLTVDALNVSIAYSLFLRTLSTHPTSSSSSLSSLYGSTISPSTYFDLKGFSFTPHPLSPSSPPPDLSPFFTAVRDELAVLEAAGHGRTELQALLSTEAEFAYIPLTELAHEPRVGVGAFRFMPAQVPDSHINELGRSLNRKLKTLPSAMQQPFPTSPFLPLTPPAPVSLFRPGVTVRGAECTIIDLTPQLLTRGLAALWSDVKQVAAHLSLPKRVMADVSESVQRGIKEAEKKLDEVTANAYAPTNLVRWLPVVGSVVNYYMPITAGEQAAPGQSYDLRKKELNVIRYSYQTKGGGGVGGPGTGGTPTLPPAPPVDRPLSALDLQPSAQGGGAAALTESSALSLAISAAPVLQSGPHPPTPSAAMMTHTASSTLSRAFTDASSGPAPMPNPPSVPSAPSSSSATKRKLISINIDEHEKAILQTPLPPLPDVIAYLTKGVIFTSFFPSPEPPSPSPPTSSTPIPPPSSSPSFIAADLLIFYSPSYTGPDASDADLGPGPILAWSEPGQRYMSADQAIAIDHISELFLGKKGTWPGGGVGLESGRCLSVLTPQVSLWLQAESKAVRDEWFMALYALMQAMQGAGGGGKKKGEGGKKGGVNGERVKEGAKKKGVTAESTTPSISSGEPSPAPSPRLTAAAGPGEQSIDLPAARALLESGMPFTVYVLDKLNSDITTKHEVTLWFKPDPAGAASTTAGGGSQPPSPSAAAPITGHLCWCRRGAHLDYSPSRSLPITSTVQICLGRQTRGTSLHHASVSSLPLLLLPSLTSPSPCLLALCSSAQCGRREQSE